MEVEAIERLLGGYKFKNRLLLEEAFTHSSADGQPSYERLEFIGDAALGLAVTNFVFLTNPTLGPGPLTLLRSANISTEKLARAVVRHGLYRFLRHTSTTLDHLVGEFTAMVMKEAMEDAGRMQHGGYIKAPKVLADIVESFAAAVYIDCDYNLEIFWKVASGGIRSGVRNYISGDSNIAAQEQAFGYENKDDGDLDEDEEDDDEQDGKDQEEDDGAEGDPSGDENAEGMCNMLQEE